MTVISSLLFGFGSFPAPLFRAPPPMPFCRSSPPVNKRKKRNTNNREKPCHATRRSAWQKRKQENKALVRPPPYSTAKNTSACCRRGQMQLTIAYDTKRVPPLTLALKKHTQQPITYGFPCMFHPSPARPRA